MVFRCAVLLIVVGGISCWVRGAGAGDKQKKGETMLTRFAHVPTRFINKPFVASSRNPVFKPQAMRQATISGGILSANPVREPERFGDESVRQSLADAALKLYNRGYSDMDITTRIDGYIRENLEMLLQGVISMQTAKIVAAFQKIQTTGFRIVNGQFCFEENKEAGGQKVSKITAFEQTVAKLQAAVSSLENSAANGSEAGSRPVSAGAGASNFANPSSLSATSDLRASSDRGAGAADARRPAPKGAAVPTVPVAPTPQTRRLARRALSAAATANNRIVVPESAENEERKERECPAGAGDDAARCAEERRMKLAFATQAHLLNIATGEFDKGFVNDAQIKAARARFEFWKLDIEGRRNKGLFVPNTRPAPTAEMGEAELT